MAVDDHGLEAIRKSAEEVTSGSKADYYLKVSSIFSGSILEGVIWDYTAQTQAATTDTWVFRTGGAGGTITATIVITYTSSAKAVIANVAKT